MRMEIIRAYDSEFSTLEWILMLVVNLLLLALTVLLAVLLVKLFRRIFRFRVPVKKYDEMVKQVRNLQRDLLRANYEKDKLLALKVAELGLDPSQADAALLEEEEETAEADTDYSSRRNTLDSPCVDPADSRFYRLTEVDNYYKTAYTAPVYDNAVTLEELCRQFRLFAASQMKLYYDLKMIRHFIASLGAARIVILQGISGTAKPRCPTLSANLCRRIRRWFRFSLPGENEPNCTGISMSLPKSIPKPISSGPFMRATTSGIPTW